MGLAQKGVAYIEPEEYLALEAVARDKHEYLDGVILAWQGYTVRGMAGASVNHNRVATNVLVALRTALAGSDCEVFAADLRVTPLRDTAYFYPDVMVRCGEPLAGDALITDDACLVVEVLSPTTEGFDRNDKFQRYCEMETLQSFVLVDIAYRRIEVRRRANGWLPDPDVSSDGVHLGLLGLVLNPSAVFARVT